MLTNRLTPLAASLAATLAASAALAGPLGVVDNFNDTSLAEYTASYILEQDATNAITFASPAGVLQVSKSTGANAEQVVFLRNDYTLAIGEMLRIDSAGADVAVDGNGGYADFGIAVATNVNPADAVWTTGTADARSGVLAVYGKPAFNTVGWLGRSNNAVPGADLGSNAGSSVTGMANPTNADWTSLYRGLWIKRNTSTNFTAGWRSSAGSDVQLVSWNAPDGTFGNAVGIFADLRAVHTYGDLDNLRIVAVPEPAAWSLALVGFAALRRRTRKLA